MKNHTILTYSSLYKIVLYIDLTNTFSQEVRYISDDREPISRRKRSRELWDEYTAVFCEKYREF